MNKFCIFPITDTESWDIYKKQIKAFWTIEEIDFSQDYNDFITLSSEIQHSIKLLLAFFSNSDGLVNFNIQNNLLNNYSKEIGFVYVFQMFMEQIHNECYSFMIESIVRDVDEKEILFNSIEEIKEIKEISSWGLNYSMGPYSNAEKILVFICFEGIMFSGAFAFIFWIKKIYNKGTIFLNGLIKSNEFISRDEGMHTDFGISVFNKYHSDLEDKKKIKIITDCVELSKKFNKSVLHIKYTGMNNELMDKYIEYMADRIFVSIGMKKYYNSQNPFNFMNTIGMMQKTNFHEGRPTEYQRVKTKTDFKTTDEF